MFIAFNSTFAPLFALGFLGMPRRVVTYPTNLQALNDWVSVSAFVLGLSMLVFLYNVVWSLVIKREPAEANPWNSKSAEWQLPTPVPVYDFERIPVFDADPYPYGVEPTGPAGGRAGPGGGVAHGSVSSARRPHRARAAESGSRGRCGSAARMLCGVVTFFFLSFLFAYFYLRSLDTNNSWKIGKVDPHGGVRDRDRRAVRRERGDAARRRHATG